MAEQNGKQVVKADPSKVVAYEAADGQKMELTVEIVKKYLVQGKPELITIQELVYFLNICKARRLNPLVKDCYLVKYDNSPAAIITSIDFYRKQAKAQPDCKGWTKGVILWDPEGKKEIRTNGLVPPGLKLIGAWFKAKPQGWEVDFDLEVNLNGYIKKTRDGNPTQFWSEANQPSQIMKVAEAQGLRTIWPGLFQNIYEESEISAPDDLTRGAIDVGQDADKVGGEILEANWKAAMPAGQNFDHLDEFLKVTADRNRISVEDLKRKILQEGKAESILTKVYPAWAAKVKPAPAPAAADPEMAPGPCPNSPLTTYSKEHCDKQTCRNGCPVWPDEEGAA